MLFVRSVLARFLLLYPREATTNKLDEARALIADGFKLANYRAAAFTPALAVSTPVWSELTRDASRKEPPHHLRLHPAGRSKKKRGRKEAKSVETVEEAAAVVTSSSSSKGYCDQAHVSVDPGLASSGTKSKDIGSGLATGSQSVEEVSTKASVAAGSSRTIVDLSLE